MGLNKNKGNIIVENNKKQGKNINLPVVLDPKVLCGVEVVPLKKDV